MPSPRNHSTSLPVICDKPSRKEIENVSNFKHGHLKDDDPLGTIDSDLSRIRNLFHHDVSTVKAGPLLNVPVSQDEVDLASRPRTCMPQIAAVCGLTSSKNAAHCGHPLITRKETFSGPSSSHRFLYQEDVDIPLRRQSTEASPTRTRRGRTHGKCGLGKQEDEEILLQVNDADMDLTRRSAQFSERKKDRKRRSCKPKTKTYSRLTRDALSSDFATPLPRHSRIFNWLVDCKEKTDDSVPAHLPDISLTCKYKHSRE